MQARRRRAASSLNKGYQMSGVDSTTHAARTLLDLRHFAACRAWWVTGSAEFRMFAELSDRH